MLCSHPLIDGGLVVDKQAGKFLSANCVWSKVADSAQSVVKYSALSAAWNTFAFPANRNFLSYFIAQKFWTSYNNIL